MNPSDQKIKLLIIGLDCAEPSIVFDQLTRELPNLNKLRKSGSWGSMKSTDPPLTIPAWTSMVSGYDPGTLGIYGIRNRRDYTYNDLSISFSSDVHVPRLWDYMGQQGRTSIIVGVPQTYPIKPISGFQISCMLTPDTEHEFSYPDNLRHEIQSITSGYIIDIPDYRTLAPSDLLKSITEMTSKRSQIFRHLLQTRTWDFGMMVEIGLDRLHHCFWHFWDHRHPLYFSGNSYQNAIPDYYRFLDSEIGKLLAVLPPDTAVFIVSDHGAQRMMGSIRINQWLINEGYLKLRIAPGIKGALKRDWVDWSSTVAWGEGGYYSRIFLNVKNREPQGCIPQSRFHEIREELAGKIRNMKGPDGSQLNNQVFFPENLYSVTAGLPPDMMVYFGDMSWRSLSEIGFDSIFTRHNDQGPDGANHAHNGIFISSLPIKNQKSPFNLDILDITPSALNLTGIPIPAGLKGKPCISIYKFRVFFS